jgi:hypothetical protein
MKRVSEYHRFHCQVKNMKPTLSMGRIDGADLYSVARDFLPDDGSRHSFWNIVLFNHKQEDERGPTKLGKGHAIAQAVSRRLPAMAARVQTRVWSCGIL